MNNISAKKYLQPGQKLQIPTQGYDEYVKSLPDDKDLINEWWEEIGDYYDEYNNPYDIDPTPDADSPYSDAEYIVTAKERSKIAFEQKLRDKG